MLAVDKRQRIRNFLGRKIAGFLTVEKATVASKFANCEGRKRPVAIRKAGEGSCKTNRRDHGLGDRLLATVLDRRKLAVPRLIDQVTADIQGMANHPASFVFGEELVADDRSKRPPGVRTYA